MTERKLSFRQLLRRIRLAKSLIEYTRTECKEKLLALASTFEELMTVYQLVDRINNPELHWKAFLAVMDKVHDIDGLVKVVEQTPNYSKGSCPRRSSQRFIIDPREREEILTDAACKFCHTFDDWHRLFSAFSPISSVEYTRGVAYLEMKKRAHDLKELVILFFSFPTGHHTIHAPGGNYDYQGEGEGKQILGLIHPHIKSVNDLQTICQIPATHGQKQARLISFAARQLQG